ncbi:hypothetical protein PC128_g26283 [Phytophthora cactorum]|nr:hypothetical protein PC120_g25945 [Phytophthora cactorum]KAG3039229.1 hypothetical protein PC121_g23757 [Phytophthora cactorum]KAG3133843.1 hypothetical protein PC128_g26283 [Phytophthora cactorum]KAG4038179.1 hypothetical protein PC123_g26259 [Phytophthora cactorum]
MTTVPCTDTVTKDNTSVQGADSAQAGPAAEKNTSVQGTDSAQTAHMRERTPY